MAEHNLTEKTCSLCGYIKPYEDFGKKLAGTTARCRECLCRVERERRAANPEEYRQRERSRLSDDTALYQRKLAANRDWYARNREYNLARRKIYWKENSERYRGYIAAWRKRNPERARELSIHHERKRRAIQRGAEVNPSEVITIREIAARDEYVCHICLELVTMTIPWPEPDSPSKDHVIPLAAGGAHTMANIKLAHLLCNLRKQDKLPPASEGLPE